MFEAIAWLNALTYDKGLSRSGDARFLHAWIGPCKYSTPNHIRNSAVASPDMFLQAGRVLQGQLVESSRPFRM